ncbi:MULTISPECIES: MFS transporter [Alicyclobacillus]|uniref:MFS transporter n=1 Tax=Alicyclobacillus TaxID=29330 RepID=UPI001A8FA447|nr:MFS transporter [Alicyclobacillus mali (ex Roth et al. 2021)]
MAEVAARRRFAWINVGEGVQYAFSSFRDGAVMWLVYVDTHSTLAVSFIPVARLASALISPISGALVDRSALRKVIHVTNGLRALVSFATACALLMHVDPAWCVYVSYFISGLVNRFYYPAFFTAYNKLLTDDLRFRTMSVTNSVIMTSSIAGGVLVGVSGSLPLVFAVSGLAYLLTLACQWIAFRECPELDVRAASPRQGTDRSLRTSVREFATYMAHHPAILWLGVLAWIPEITIKMVDMLTPEFVISHAAGRISYGLFLATFSAGAAVASLVSARWKVKREHARLMGLYATSGAVLAAAGLLHWTGTALALYALLGAGLMIENNARHALRVSLTDMDYNGRVSSMSDTFTSIVVTASSVAIGWAASHLSVDTVYVTWGPVTALIALAILAVLRRWLRGQSAIPSAAAADPPSAP